MIDLTDRLRDMTMWNEPSTNEVIRAAIEEIQSLRRVVAGLRDGLPGFDEAIEQLQKEAANWRSRMECGE